MSARSSPDRRATSFALCVAVALALFGCRSRPHRHIADPDLASVVEHRRSVHAAYKAEVLGRFVTGLVNGTCSAGDDRLPSYSIYESMHDPEF